MITISNSNDRKFLLYKTHLVNLDVSVIELRNKITEEVILPAFVQTPYHNSIGIELLEDPQLVSGNPVFDLTILDTEGAAIYKEEITITE